MKLARKQKGSILVFSLILFFVMLTIALSIASVSLNEKKSVSVTDNSSQAFQRTDTAAEIFITKVKTVTKIGELDEGSPQILSCISTAGDPNIGRFTSYPEPAADAKDVYTITLYDSNGMMDCTAAEETLVSAITKIKIVGISNGTARATEVGVNSPFNCGNDSVVDVDGNVYETVVLGSQCWMRENLRTTRYADGTSITKGPAAHLATGWNDDTTAYYSCPPNAANNGEDCAAAEAAKLGLLYQWKAAMNSQPSNCNGGKCQGACPIGWHLPTDAEWITLEETLGMCTGAVAPCSGTTGWRGTDQGTQLKTVSPNMFSALFAGYRAGDAGNLGKYMYRDSNAYYWSSTASSITNAWRRGVSSAEARIYRGASAKYQGFSVRCIKD